MKRTTLYFLLSISWLVISTFLLVIPGTAFPKEDWLSKLWFDKWVHIGVFALLVYFWCMALSRPGTKISKMKSYFIGIAIAGFAYGVGMEFVQKYFVSNRTFDPGDIIADGAGCIAGLIFCWGRYIKK